MTTLSSLSVSLTKHGAHKIALLLAKYDKDEVLNHLSGTDSGINIESAQAHKNLSVRSGIVPEVWNKARIKGKSTINALVFIAIIFSHYKLISAMKTGAGPSPLKGTIRRGIVIDEKAFTNFAHTIEELGFSTEHTTDHVSYDLNKLFKIDGLSQLVREIFELKLTSAGWDKKNSLFEEITRLEFHKVFSVSSERFLDWLSSGTLPSQKLNEDATFFLGTDESSGTGKFKFVAGHRKKKTGKVSVSSSDCDVEASLLHNEIQNGLFEHLAEKYGAEKVGTEIPTGQGTSIDLVVSTDDFCWFYEIKTAPLAKACIRQAIPQLLEYAYWDCDSDKADRLIIVGPVAITQDARAYLDFLRKKFSIPIYYEKFDVLEK
jgi:hypothetical protein